MTTLLVPARKGVLAPSAMVLATVLGLIAVTPAPAAEQHETKGLFGQKKGALPPPPVDRDALTPDEMKLDCKKLAGRMQIRIMQLRAERGRDNPSAVAKSLQTVAKPVYGGTVYGRDPVTQASRDRAWLESGNKQLAAKNCRTFDLDAELKKPASDPPPALQPKAKAAAPAAK